MKELSKNILLSSSIVALVGCGGDGSSSLQGATYKSPISTIDKEKVYPGAQAGLGDSVTIHYILHDSDGNVYDSTLERKQPISFTIGAAQISPKIQEVVTGMKVGSTEKTSVTQDDLIGGDVQGNIPVDAELVYEVKLMHIR